MLSDKTIFLRALEPSDIDLLYQWENDCSLWEVSNTLTPYSRHVLEQYVMNAHLDIYSTKQLRLIIELKENHKTVGCIDLFDFDPLHKRAGVGILIADKKEQGHGFASAATSLLIDYAFNKLNMNQLYCNVTSDNESSLKLFAKCGFKPVGLKKKWIIAGGVWKDEFLLQLLNTHSSL
jgi:diamine N-acetyltransferase